MYQFCIQLRLQVFECVEQFLCCFALAGLRSRPHFAQILKFSIFLPLACICQLLSSHREDLVRLGEKLVFFRVAEKKASAGFLMVKESLSYFVEDGSECILRFLGSISSYDSMVL